MGKQGRYRPYDAFEGCRVFEHDDGRVGRIVRSDPATQTVIVDWRDGARETVPWDVSKQAGPSVDQRWWHTFGTGGSR